jgi:hypothetical protein
MTKAAARIHFTTVNGRSSPERSELSLNERGGGGGIGVLRDAYSTRPCFRSFSMSQIVTANQLAQSHKLISVHNSIKRRHDHLLPALHRALMREMPVDVQLALFCSSTRGLRFSTMRRRRRTI